jgi:hypothetical protein
MNHEFKMKDPKGMRRADLQAHGAAGFPEKRETPPDCCKLFCAGRVGVILAWDPIPYHQMTGCRWEKRGRRQ